MRSIGKWWHGQVTVCSECGEKVLLDVADKPRRASVDFPETMQTEDVVTMVLTVEFDCPCKNGTLLKQLVEETVNVEFPRVVA